MVDLERMWNATHPTELFVNKSRVEQLGLLRLVRRAVEVALFIAEKDKPKVWRAGADWVVAFEREWGIVPDAKKVAAQVRSVYTPTEARTGP